MFFLYNRLLDAITTRERGFAFSYCAFLEIVFFVAFTCLEGDHTKQKSCEKLKKTCDFGEIT
jgi:hypothetical protein